MTVAASRGVHNIGEFRKSQVRTSSIDTGQWGSLRPSRECLFFEFMVTLVGKALQPMWQTAPRLTLRVHHLCRLCMLHCVPWSAEWNESLSHSFSCCVSLINCGSKWFTKFESLGSLEVGCHPWESKVVVKLAFFCIRKVAGIAMMLTDEHCLFYPDQHLFWFSFQKTTDVFDWQIIPPCPSQDNLSLRQAKKNVSAPIHRGALLNAAEATVWSESCIIGVTSFSLPTHLRKMKSTMTYKSLKKTPSQQKQHITFVRHYPKVPQFVDGLGGAAWS